MRVPHIAQRPNAATAAVTGTNILNTKCFMVVGGEVHTRIVVRTSACRIGAYPNDDFSRVTDQLIWPADRKIPLPTANTRSPKKQACRFGANAPAYFSTIRITLSMMLARRAAIASGDSTFCLNINAKVFRLDTL